MSNETPAEVLADIARRIVNHAMPATESGATCFVPRYQIDQLSRALEAERALAAVKVAVWMRQGATTEMHNFRFEKPDDGPWVPLYYTAPPADPAYGSARLYNAINHLMAQIGCHGEINSKAPECAEVMAALSEIDGGTYKPADPAKASGSAPDGFVMMPRASVEMLADIEVEDIDDPNGPGWTKCPACGESALGKWEAGKYQRPAVGHNSDCPVEAAQNALATPPASAPEVTDAMVLRALSLLPAAPSTPNTEWEQGYSDAMQLVRQEMPAALTAALREPRHD